MTDEHESTNAEPLVFRNKAVGKVGLALTWMALGLIAVHAAGVYTFAVTQGHVWPLAYIETALLILALPLINMNARRVTINGDEVEVKKVFTTLRLRRGEMLAWSWFNLLPTVLHVMRGGSSHKHIYFVRGPGPRLFAIGWWIEDYERAVELMTTDVRELPFLLGRECLEEPDRRPNLRPEGRKP